MIPPGAGLLVTAPEGMEPARVPATLGAKTEEPPIMPETARQPSPARTRPAVTLEAAIAACPDEKLADRIADAFGLDQVATAEIRERTRLLLIEMTRMLEDQLSEKALALHLQRVVAGFVGSACRSGQFFPAKLGLARELGSRLHDEHPDEDCGGVAGFAGRAQRAREFAAEPGAAGACRPGRGGGGGGRLRAI